MSANHFRLPRRLATVPLVTAAILAGCNAPTADAPRTAPAAPTVSVVTVEPAAVERVVTLPGRVAASQIAEVRPQVNGLIVERLFEEGSDVAEGDPLYRIDPAPYQVAYDQARGDLARAEATVISTQAQRSRFEGLVERGGVSRQDYDDAVAAAAVAEADVVVARAARDSAKISLDRTTITAPIAGRIGRSTVTVGALVTAQQADALSTITALDPVFVDVTRPSAQMMRDTNDEALSDIDVTLTLEDGSDYGQTGELTLSEAAVDPSSASITLRSVFPNPDGTLLPGMFVRASIHEGTQDDAILVPQSAISRASDGTGQVFVLTSEGKAVARAVTTDRSVGQNYVVTGVEAGETIILDGFQRFASGDAVTPMRAEADSRVVASADATAR